MEIEGIVLTIIYENESNGYKIIKVLDNDSQNEEVFIGYMPFVNVGDTIKARGEWANHSKYGLRFKVDTFEKNLPETKDAIIFFLSSGIIKGIRETMANKIVETLGEDTLNIIQNDVDKLATVQGISRKKAIEISQIVNENLGLRRITIFLNENNIPTSYLSTIYKVLGKDTIEKIKENPYILTDEKIGINFKIADKIAEKIGIDMFIEERNKSAVKYVLYRAMTYGHVYLPITQLKKDAKKLLDIDDETLENVIINMSFEDEVVFEKNDDETRAYLNSNYYAENYVAAKIAQLSLKNYQDELENIEEHIQKFEEHENIKLEDTQKEAVIKAVTKGAFVLTGGPGTGKTTIIKAILYILNLEDLTTVLAAPTGRAAKRMTEITGVEAKTIHRLLETDFKNGDNNQKFFRNERNPLEADVIIVDEMSMVDLILMRDLLKAVSKNTRLILVGDVNQLASIGVGNVLKDIIESQMIETVVLTKIFRQANESLIISNAHKINKGELPELKERTKDFFFISRKNDDDVIYTVVDLCSNRLPKTYNYNPIKDIQVITPMRRGKLGVINLNKELQSVLNPDDIKKKSKITNTYKLMVGDKVMQMQNNYNIEWHSINGNYQEYGEGVFNGDIGIIEDINYTEQKVVINFDEQRIAEYEFDLLEEIEISYAITVHKSQGSEFPVVIIPLLEGPMILFTRNLLYTAVTRAKEMVIIVGSEEMVNKMVNNFREDRKYSALSERIKNYLD